MIFRHKLCHPKEKKHWLNLACLPKIRSNKYPLRFTFLLLQSNLQGSRVQIYERTSEFSFFGPHGFSVTVLLLQIKDKKFSCLQNPKKLQHSRAPGTFCVFFALFIFFILEAKTGNRTFSQARKLPPKWLSFWQWSCWKESSTSFCPFGYILPNQTKIIGQSNQRLGP